MTHVRPFIRPLVRPLVRSGAVGPNGGLSYQDGIHLNFASGSSSVGHYVKVPGAAPTVSPFTSLFTFTCGNQSMFMGPNGLLVQAVTNVPRIEYDANGNCLGLLMEASRTNICLESQTLDSGTWTKTAASISANATTAPDGTSTADTLVEDSTTAIHSAAQSISFVSGTTYTMTVYAKAAGRGWAFLQFPAAAFTTGTFAFFDLATGAVGATQNTPTTSVQALPNGWYRLIITKAATATVAASVALTPASANGTNNYLGNGTSGIHLWGCQIEAAAFPSSYIPTTTVSVTRTADSCIRTLGSEFSATAGTVVVAGRSSGGQAVGIGQCVWSLWTDVNNRYTYVRPSASDVARLTINNGGVNQATLDATFANSAIFKAASAWVANDFATTINGGAVLTDGAGTLPAVAVLGLGELGDTSSTMNGHILRFDYWPERRSNAFLQQASA